MFAPVSLRWALLGALFTAIFGSPYDVRFIDYNLNLNPDTNAPVTSFSASWEGHSYFSSPVNWRSLPTYTVLMDRWADGDPSRNDYDGTMYEWDMMSNQLRYGGDIQGFLGAGGRTLDYVQSMGIKALYVAGTPFINMPWQYDQYSALDFTILAPHFGTIDDWRQLVTELHNRGVSSFSLRNIEFILRAWAEHNSRRSTGRRSGVRGSLAGGGSKTGARRADLSELDKRTDS